MVQLLRAKMDFALTSEQRELRERVRRIAREELLPLAPEADESEELHPEVTSSLRRHGLFRYLIPEEFGGLGLKVVNLCIIREELSYACVQADTTFAMSGLGSYPIIICGNESQKQKFLPPIATGEKLGSFALTEPGAGSDVAAIETTAILEGDFYILNGTKRFISQCGAADVYTVFAKTDPSAGGKGISAFIVEAGTPGFDTSYKMKLMAAHIIGQPKFENCRVPKENLLGSPGEGMKIALSTLDVYRTTVGAAAIGMAQAAYDEALNYAIERKAFGLPLTGFQAIQFKLAEMITAVEAARLLVYRAAWLKDSGKERVIKEASMAKYFATEAAQMVIDQAVQIFGGLGVVRGVTVERLYREIRATRIYEGTSEIQKLVIAREELRGKGGPSKE